MPRKKTTTKTTTPPAPDTAPAAEPNPVHGLTPLPDDSQCKGCLHYRLGESLERGRHVCASFPMLPDYYVNNRVPCPVGPVRGRRLGDK